MKFLKAFGQFWYEFIIGDDWKVAAAVVLALVLAWLMLRAGVRDEVVTAAGGALVLACFTGALFIDRRGD